MLSAALSDRDSTLRLSRELAPFDQRADHTPGVIRFGAETTGYLAGLLRRFESEDPYMTCPAYHAFTGRKGLWGYARAEALLLFARHPMNPHQILIYPQLGQQLPYLALDLIEHVAPPLDGFRFARIAAEKAEFLAAALNRRSEIYSFVPEKETVLDWTFPVHTVATSNLIDPAGGTLKNFRNRLHKIDPDKARIEPIDVRRDSDALLRLVRDWAAKKQDLDSAQIMECYTALFELLHRPALKFEGIKINYEDRLTAFEIWTRPKPGNTRVNNFAGFNACEVQGFSEFQHHILAKALNAKGVKEICLGGSEAEGLDRFKRKMAPVSSVPLCSIKVIPVHAESHAA